MRKRFENPWRTFLATRQGGFFQELPTAAERRVFAEAFPYEFYNLFGFFSHQSDKWPASAHYELRDIFRRPAAEFMEMLEAHRAHEPFSAPDVSSLPYHIRNVALARARGEWWRANGFPMGKREREWLAMTEAGQQRPNDQ